MFELCACLFVSVLFGISCTVAHVRAVLSEVDVLSSDERCDDSDPASSELSDSETSMSCIVTTRCNKRDEYPCLHDVFAYFSVYYLVSHGLASLEVS